MKFFSFWSIYLFFICSPFQWDPLIQSAVAGGGVYFKVCLQDDVNQMNHLLWKTLLVEALSLFPPFSCN